MEIFLEIVKYTLPAIIVFLSSYLILKKYLDAQLDLKSIELRARYSKDAIPLKLQAYERLLLFCERISIPNLIMRLKTNTMRVEDLQRAMMISIQKEYEHNMAQQLYASPKLWDIISLVKNDMISMVDGAAKSLAPQESAKMLSDALFDQLNKLDRSPVDVAITAIKEEAKIILDV